MKKTLLRCLGAALVLSAVCVTGCAKEAVRQDREISASDRQTMNHLLGRIQEINSRAPRSFSVSFNVEGIYNKKKFKSMGEALYLQNPLKMKVTLFDFVFKSPLSVLMQEGDSVSFYFPVEKTLYRDSMKTLKLSNYTSLDLDYRIIAAISVGRIPLLEGYTVRQGLTAKADKPGKGEELFLILENEASFETISFRKDIPDKILLLNKTTKERFEIYLENPYQKDQTLFYRSARFISHNTGDRITLTFKNFRHNFPLDPNTITRVNLPRDVRVIEVK